MSMRVDFMMSSMSRQAGGLYDATRNLALELTAYGWELKVRSALDARSSEDRKDWGNLSVVTSQISGPASFGYQRGLTASIFDGSPDLLHQHGIWTYSSYATLRWSERTRRPRVISPHGMLDPWAVKNSAWKKRLVSYLYESQNLHGATCLHALNQSELAALRDYGIKGPVAVIPNGVDTIPADQTYPDPLWAERLPNGAQVLLFLGRIHPKKGLCQLLKALADVGDKRLGSWHLVIAGWEQGGHGIDLRELADRLDISHRVHFVGPQFDENKGATLARANAFVLPSLSEGLPIAVLEAWSFRLPVLMTEACNLPEGFAVGAATMLSKDYREMVGDLEAFLALSEVEHMRSGMRGRHLVEKNFAWKSIAARMSKVYDWCLGSGPEPDCVAVENTGIPRSLAKANR